MAFGCLLACRRRLLDVGGLRRSLRQLGLQRHRALRTLDREWTAPAPGVHGERPARATHPAIRVSGVSPARTRRLYDRVLLEACDRPDVEAAAVTNNRAFHAQRRQAEPLRSRCCAGLGSPRRPRPRAMSSSSKRRSKPRGRPSADAALGDQALRVLRLSGDLDYLSCEDLVSDPHRRVPQPRWSAGCWASRSATGMEHALSWATRRRPMTRLSAWLRPASGCTTGCAALVLRRDTLARV